MKYPEKDIAKYLYSDLVQRFAGRTPVIQCKIKRSNFNNRCTVKQGENFCCISCFAAISGTEYLISFERNSAVIAMGRTSSKLEVIRAVDDWVNGSELSVLYNKFLFIDRYKRGILGIRDDLIANFPELSELAKLEQEQELSEFCHLWFEHGDRRVYVCFWSNTQEIVNITGYWDKSSGLFGIQSHDRKFLAEIVKRWVCDRALPSEIRTEFPSVEMSTLADFYEQGNPIEGEFLQSWDFIERFYESQSKFYGESVNPMIELVKSIRKEGYDRKLRAGQSMMYLCLSRSRSHGNMGKSHIVFRSRYEDVAPKGKGKSSQHLRVTYCAKGAIIEEFVEKEIALTDRIRKVLQKLSEQPIYSPRKKSN
jgi:hypothetical protein